MLPKTRTEFDKIMQAVRLLHDINVEVMPFEHLDEKTFDRYVDALQKMQNFNKLLYVSLIQLQVLSDNEKNDYIIVKTSDNEN